MNQILEFLQSHASCRSFINKRISAVDEQTIVATAQRAPTSSNLQAYSVISIRDRETKMRLSELTGDQMHVRTCGLFLVFCADLYRLSRLALERGYPFHGDYAEPFIVATVDASLAAGRALQAAQALELGGVMVGGIRNHPDEVCDLLKLPEMTYPVMGMSLGYPKRPPKVKPRLPSRALHFAERYDPTQIDEAVEKYDALLHADGYLTGREVETENYPSFEGRYSWSEHSARRMASKKPGALRPHMLEFLHRRGLLKR
jgi:nitroreductase